MKSKTLENFENALDKLNDVETENEYVTLPKDIRDTNINDYKKVWNNFAEYYNLDSYKKVAKDGQQALRKTYDWGFENVDAFNEQTKSIFSKAKET